MSSSGNRFGPEYASIDDATFIPKYRAACFCGTVRYEVSADPVEAKICHCLACRKLHGAPMQWAAIFHKRHVRFTAGLHQLRFFNSEQGLPERILPCKVSCGRCVVLPLPMRGAGCGLLSPRCLILGFAARRPIHSSQPAISSMLCGWSTSGTICPNGPGTRTIPPCCQAQQIS